MAKDSHKSTGAHGAEKTSATLSGLFADENELDRRALWRLGWWGAGAVGAVALAVFTNQTAQGWRQDRISATDLSRQAQLIQSLARETQGEARQLGAAIETLNTDRDRLYARVTVLEQGLDSVTGALAKQSSQAVPAPPPGSRAVPAPQIAAAESQPVPASNSPNSSPAFAGMSPFVAAPSGVPGTNAGQPGVLAAPSPLPFQAGAAAAPAVVADKTRPEASKALSSAAAASPSSSSAASEPVAGKPADSDKLAKADPAETAGAKGTESAEGSATGVQKTEFAVDLGGANSIGGLRALWRGLAKSNADLAALRPIIILKEGQTGPGMQLRLGAGPLSDAAAAARICAALAESQRSCETTVYDGQRLAVRDEPEGSDAGKAAAPAAAVQKPFPAQRRRTFQPQAPQQRHGKREEPPPAAAAAPAPPAEAPKPEQPSALSSFFRRS
ncbi:hypothetical protein LQG66_04775 [Bradyrhizobium ontarionense]|uniref:SPOR domain-containing protein n=1 Tax=Bradyrhizobium ontarionense TaxID=2898149 RepID=A0ABY3RFQ8_9BRAD|nr:hypothetical protein [Bradyrhizobium sp. A19]UFZ05632.1 hypothetical protein LQG66_04775 [Bradyrhizobium sp. A19]